VVNIQQLTLADYSGLLSIGSIGPLWCSPWLIVKVTTTTSTIIKTIIIIIIIITILIISIITITIATIPTIVIRFPALDELMGTRSCFTCDMVSRQHVSLVVFHKVLHIPNH